MYHYWNLIVWRLKHFGDKPIELKIIVLLVFSILPAAAAQQNNRICNLTAEYTYIDYNCVHTFCVNFRLIGC